jgi:hypothetical protein
MLSLQARVEHLLMQNKELLSHLQKLMSQLSEIQKLQQSLAVQGTAADPPPQTNTPTTSPALSQMQTTPTSDTKLILSPVTGESSPPPLTIAELPDEPGPALPRTMASTPSTKTSKSADDADPSDMSLGLDFNLISSPATNDPFIPQVDAALPTSS